MNSPIFGGIMKCMIKITQRPEGGNGSVFLYDSCNYIGSCFHMDAKKTVIC